MSHILGDQRPAKYAALLAEGETKTRAALLAGYSRHQARRAHELIEKRPNVRRALERYSRRAEATPVRILEQLRRVAESDLASFYNDDGSAIPLSKLTPEQRSALQSCETIVKNAQAGDGVVDTVLRIKLHDKMEAAKLLMMYHHMLDQHVQVDTDVRVTVTWQKADALTDAQQQMIDVTPTDKQEPT